MFFIGSKNNMAPPLLYSPNNNDIDPGSMALNAAERGFKKTSSDGHETSAVCADRRHPPIIKGLS